MKKIFSIVTLLLSVIIITYTGCKKNDVITNPAAGLKKIASAYATGAATKVEIYAKDSLFTGYNKLYIALIDSVTGKFVEEGHIHLHPLMVMSPTMSHSSPFENPSSEEAVNQLFPCSITFIMSGAWALSIDVHNHVSDLEGTAELVLNVKDPAEAKVFSFVSAADANKYFIALISPASPVVGINDMELAIYKKQSMMAFPADSSMSLVLTPEMPTMGHGSPNNINPVHIGNGHYKGKVNFTMTGLWRLNLDFNAGISVADSTHYFDITL